VHLACKRLALVFLAGISCRGDRKPEWTEKNSRSQANGNTAADLVIEAQRLKADLLAIRAVELWIGYRESSGILLRRRCAARQDR
jgi:hypothetical protein